MKEMEKEYPEKIEENINPNFNNIPTQASVEMESNITEQDNSTCIFSEELIKS
jgi:hypothetical protein